MKARICLQIGASRMKMYEVQGSTHYSNLYSNYLELEPLLARLLLLSACHRPCLSQPCSSSKNTRKQICLMSWPIEAIAEINVWSDFCCGRQLVATYFYVSQEEGGASLVNQGTLSGSDGTGLSGEVAKVSWLTPSASVWIILLPLTPALALPYQSVGDKRPTVPLTSHSNFFGKSL